MTLRESLIALGYTESEPGRWLKPIGYMLFTVEEGRPDHKDRWSNWFKDLHGKVSLFEDAYLYPYPEKGDYLNQIKILEAYTRVDVCTESRSEFHLKAIDL